MTLLQMSFSGSILILVIVVIRALAINKLPKRTFLLLWEIVIIRLLLPFFIPSEFSVYSFIKQCKRGEMFFTEAEENMVNLTLSGNIFNGVHSIQQSNTASVSIWFTIWCIGTMFFAIYFVVSYLYFRFEFKTSFPVHDDFTEQWLRKNQTKRVVSIRQSERFSTPLTYGIFHPTILIPKMEWTNMDQLQYVLLHEYMHISHYDTAKKLLAIIALCVHWFNPFVWAMCILFNRDIELACDESVINCMGENSRSIYALMLIHMEARKSGITPFCSNFSKNAIEERITAIMKMKKRTILSFAAACIVVLSTVTVFATSSSESSGQMTDMEMTKIALQRLEKEYPAVAEWTRKCYPDTVWWTYEGYKQMMDEEREELESMIGKYIGNTPSTGNITVTSEMIEQRMAEHEEILTEIQNGWMVSKSMDGNENFGGSFNAADIEAGTGKRELQCSVLFKDGTEKVFGPYQNEEELLYELKSYCNDQVRSGNMNQKELDEIVDRYS